MAKRVVIVDDNRDLVDTMALLLGHHGFETKSCYDALDIVNCVREFDPDVVIMDLAMPQKSGLDAAKEIRDSIPGKRPILIALTAEMGKATEYVARKMGLDYYLHKAADPNVVTKLLASI